MPTFGSHFSGLAKCRKLTDTELVRAIRFMVDSEYDTTHLYIQLAESTDNKLALEVLKDIADEELLHGGKFCGCSKNFPQMRQSCMLKEQKKFNQKSRR
jgi:rubrerythrin